MVPALALALALILSAGGQPPTDEKADTRATVDVVVADARGRPVENLTAAEVSVTEHGVPLTVESIRFVRPAPPTVSRAEGTDESAITPSTRLFGILLDEFHVTPGASADRVRDALVRFVRDDLGPGDLVVVLKPLDSLLAIQLTVDREAAVRAIEAFDPRKGDYGPRSSFEREFIASAPSRIDAARAQISAASLNALATHLGAFAPQRKTIILVTEGFAPRAARRGEDALTGIGGATLSANRAHVAIYPFNPAEELSPTRNDATPDAGASNRDALRGLATDTTGRAELSADLRASLGAALGDASGYYAVTVVLPPAPGDGQFHALDVSVARRDVSVRARKGYWSVSDAERRPGARPPATGFLSAFSAGVVRRRSPLIRPWFGISPGESGTTRVSFVWEPAPRVPGERASGPWPSRVELSVKTLEGQPVFDAIVVPATEPTRRGGPESSQVSFNVPAGRFLVQMAIDDLAGRIVDRDVRDLVVGGFPGPVSLGTPEILRARTARDHQALAANPDATPIAGRRFSRAERLLMRLPVVTTGALPVVVARLVSGSGSVLRDLTVERMSSRRDFYQIEVSLAALAAGDYTIDVSASTGDGQARESLPIRVTP